MTHAAFATVVHLHDARIGWLVHDQPGHNRFVVDENYITSGPARETLSLSFVSPDGEQATAALLREAARHPTVNRLPPFFSNLLPEGALRSHVARELATHDDDELTSIRALGTDLPGAVRVVDVDVKDVPDHVFATGRAAPRSPPEPKSPGVIDFSLAGVQMKFSMSATDTGLTLSTEAGTHIVKTPSPEHAEVPANEYSMMHLAGAADVEVPQCRLVEVEALDGLPKLNLPDERYAYVIERFDRVRDAQRVHVEDFAQALGVFCHDKYGTNYATVVRNIRGRFPRALEQVEKFVRRLVVNILIGNTDAHLKNWGIIYPDGRTPELAPAYDLVSTLPYLQRRSLGLNLARRMDFYDIDESVWRRFARRSEVGDRFVLRVVAHTCERTAVSWPKLLGQLPVPVHVLDALREHWRRLPRLYRADALV